MKILWHLIRADLRRTRLWIASWILVVASAAAVQAAMPFVPMDAGAGATLSLAGSLILLSWLLLAGAIVPVIVHAHPAVGSDAFWMTRPFPPQDVFLSKLVLAAALFAGIPLVADVVVMALCQVPVHRLLKVGLQTTMVRLLALGTLMVAAAVTANLARFAVLCGAALLAPTFLLTAISAVMFSRAIDDSSATALITSDPILLTVERGTDFTPLVVTAAVLTATVLFACMVQYRTRSRWHSAGILAAGCAAGWLTATYWRIPLLEERPVIPPWAESGASLALAARTPAVSFDRRMWSNSTRWRDGVGPLAVSGVEPDWLPSVRLAGATLTLEDGTRIDSPGSAMASLPRIDAEDEAPMRIVISRLLGVRKLIEANIDDRTTPQTSVLLRVDREEAPQFESRTVRYQGRFVVSLMHMAIAGAIPLAAGGVFREDGFRLVIDDVVRRDATVSARVRTTNAGSIFERRPPPTYSFYLRNARAGEAVTGHSMIASYPPVLPIFTGLTLYPPSRHDFYTRAEIVQFPGTRFPAATTELTPEWFDGAELVIVRSISEGSVTRTLEIPTLHIVEAAAPVRAGAARTP